MTLAQSMVRFAAPAMLMVTTACTSSSTNEVTPTDAGAGADTGKPGGKIKLARNPWDASAIDVEIMRVLLTEQLKYTVEVVDVDETEQFAKLALGGDTGLHATLEVWP